MCLSIIKPVAHFGTGVSQFSPHLHVYRWSRQHLKIIQYHLNQWFYRKMLGRKVKQLKTAEKLFYKQLFFLPLSVDSLNGVYCDLWGWSVHHRDIFKNSYMQHSDVWGIRVTNVSRAVVSQSTWILLGQHCVGRKSSLNHNVRKFIYMIYSRYIHFIFS